MPEVTSPCIGVCTMDGSQGVCIGCGRTLAEIETAGRAAKAASSSLASENQVAEPAVVPTSVRALEP